MRDGGAIVLNRCARLKDRHAGNDQIPDSNIRCEWLVDAGYRFDRCILKFYRRMRSIAEGSTRRTQRIGSVLKLSDSDEFCGFLKDAERGFSFFAPSRPCAFAFL